MSFDPITYAAVQQLRKECSVGAEEPKYEYIWTSKTITVPKDAELTIRAMGAGGGGSGGHVAPITIFGLAGRRGGQGGTVALKTLNVSAGDELGVIIPAGGAGGTKNLAGVNGGTLLVHLNSNEILSIPGGGGGAGVAADDPVGADWFVKSTPPNGYGGGSAMLLEGYSATVTPTEAVGAGVLADGAFMFNMVSGGFATLDMIVLRVLDFSQGFRAGTSGGVGGVPATPAGFGAGGAAGAGGSDPTLARGGTGGFGGGGGGGSHYSSGSNHYGGDGGAGTFGGGGGAGGTYHEHINHSAGNGGQGGQGWITLEWRYI